MHTVKLLLSVDRTKVQVSRFLSLFFPLLVAIRRINTMYIYVYDKYIYNC